MIKPSKIGNKTRSERYEILMGLTHVAVEVAGIEKKKKKPYKADFLVDTGALDSMAPAKELRAAGVIPTGKKRYELASGDTIEYEVGYAKLKFLDDETVVKIIFGPPDCEPLLGVLALEGVGVMVDPVTNTLKRLHASPLK